MLGNCATGKLRMVRAPTSTSTIEITMATMGRLIKNFDMGSPSLSIQPEWLGVYLHARTHFLDTFGDHPFAGLESIRNNPLVADTVADLDGSSTDFVVSIHRGNLIGALQFRNRTLRYKQRVLLESHHRANLAVPTGTQNIVGVGKQAGESNRTGALIDLTVGKIECARTRVS